ncbi:MAG: HD domain-containing protein [Candidatus Micrarchaeota archaeon]|nr:HD domain-containing protein [Candidatus Micrarchaeota archaeon]
MAAQKKKPVRRPGGPMPYRSVADFLFEAGLLKSVGRTGWDTVRAPYESVAEHSFRTAVVGWTLSRLSGLTQREESAVVKACLFHDLHEARIGDLHRMAKMYGKLDEKKVEADQRQTLPSALRDDLAAALDRLSPRLRQMVHEADKIECAITAKEYLDAGYRTKKWIEHTRPRIKSAEGKALLAAIEKTDSSDWFLGNRQWNRGRGSH